MRAPRSTAQCFGLAVAIRLAALVRDAVGSSVIVLADTEAEAIAIAKNEMIDLVILDLHLKEGSGFGVLRALAEANATPGIIVLTSFDLPEYGEAALALGATAFLDKAHETSQLPAVVRGFLR
jgi:two-component system OmpR family response regulator